MFFANPTKHKKVLRQASKITERCPTERGRRFRLPFSLFPSSFYED
nr:MAG TPA: hypothetical protein [Caudoviricetes sp.]